MITAAQRRMQVSKGGSKFKGITSWSPALAGLGKTGRKRDGLRKVTVTYRTNTSIVRGLNLLDRFRFIHAVTREDLPIQYLETIVGIDNTGLILESTLCLYTLLALNRILLT